MIQVDDKDNFNKWFVEPIQTLSNIPDSGFPILMITIPLLERYVRSISKNFSERLEDNFYKSLIILFPVLSNVDLAKKFWDVYRNGLLHQVTLKYQSSKGGVKLPEGWLHDDKNEEIEYDSNENRFYINPRLFAKKVINFILNNFNVFKNPSYSDYPLPVFDERLLGTSVVGRFLG